MNLHVEQRPVEALIPYSRNARMHSDAQVAQIAASIVEFGWTNPILVDGDSGIIAGHGRLLAARQLKLARVPVIELGHLSPAQKRAYVIADNRLAENAGWDEELLRLELAELHDAEFDLDLLGFTEDELDRLLIDDHAGLTEDDEVPEPTEHTISRKGDVWICGSHKVLCGDATSADDYAALLGEELVDMTFTDPPYNVDYANNPKDKLRGKHRPILNDNLGSDFGAFLQAACQQILAVTKGAIYMAMSSSELDRLQEAFRAAGGRWSTFIIWAKNKFTMGHADYQRQYEPILYGWREGNDRFWCGARDQGDVWFIDRTSKNDLHPTMKPVALVERAIVNSSKSRDLILDPFGGSGTTMIACEKTGRRACLMELEPRYVDVIVRRWQEFSGQQATRARDGIAFLEIQSEDGHETRPPAV
ncbi:site-specific DNA-methyltransferase [Lysobacter capsici]|uniref:site-specific DNA-methyltransferase n=1 Tax=Lysobacter capsici TaxID=435897 RepID=UPI00287B7802|nr:site-specific DNA-methyltransferase [Lysobacter capsici]WND80406.1 site-specific DNA-methyltransferase [Lysobacter capsici]WND85603.1 site-specific DNA-methyltransferase [Lysobacter capsici]